MASFSLTTLFVVPVGNTLPTSGSTQDLNAGQFGIFRSDHSVATAANIAAAGIDHFYFAQGRLNGYLQGSKKSDKIAGHLQNGGNNVRKANVLDFYRINGSLTAQNQVTEVSQIKVKCGETVTLAIRAFSSYLNVIAPYGFKASVSIEAPCCECGADPCVDTDVPALLSNLLTKLNALDSRVGIKLKDLFTFSVSGTGQAQKLVITGKPVTKYKNVHDPGAFPYEYDKLDFDVFFVKGAPTGADFEVIEKCDQIATVTTTQKSTLPKGTPDEIRQLEKRFHSYQVGYGKQLHSMAGYNANFESWVSDGIFYNTFYIKFSDYDRSVNNWNESVTLDSAVILAVPDALTTPIQNILVAALGAPKVI